MLSDSIRRVLPRAGELAGFPPHVMFYAPNLTNEDIGFSGDPSTGLPFVAYQGPQAYMIVVSPQAWVKYRNRDTTGAGG